MASTGIGILGLHGGLATIFPEVQQQSKQFVDRLDALMKEKKDELELADAAGFTEARCKELQELEDTFSRADADISAMEKDAARCHRLNGALKEIQHRGESQPTLEESQQDSQNDKLAREIAFRAFAHIASDKDFERELIQFWGPKWNERFMEDSGIRSLTPAAPDLSQSAVVSDEMNTLREREQSLAEEIQWLLQEKEATAANTTRELDALKDHLKKVNAELSEWVA